MFNLKTMYYSVYSVVGHSADVKNMCSMRKVIFGWSLSCCGGENGAILRSSS